jgi:hypothetical protein
MKIAGTTMCHFSWLISAARELASYTGEFKGRPITSVRSCHACHCGLQPQKILCERHDMVRPDRNRIRTSGPPGRSIARRVPGKNQTCFLFRRRASCSAHARYGRQTPAKLQGKPSRSHPQLERKKITPIVEKSMGERGGMCLLSRRYAAG